MRRPHSRHVAISVFIALSVMLPVIVIAQGGLVTLARQLEPSAWAMWVYRCALFASLLLGVPPAVAAFLATRRAGRLSIGRRTGVLVGVLGGSLSAVWATTLRVAWPETWQHLTYINRPPPGPLVSPWIVFAIYLAVCLFFSWLGARGGAQAAWVEVRKRDREASLRSLG